MEFSLYINQIPVLSFPTCQGFPKAQENLMLMEKEDILAVSMLSIFFSILFSIPVSLGQKAAVDTTVCFHGGNGQNQESSTRLGKFKQGTVFVTS